MGSERERDEEIIGLLTGISVVSRQLARRLLRLHSVAPPKRRYPGKPVKDRRDGRHEFSL